MFDIHWFWLRLLVAYLKFFCSLYKNAREIFVRRLKYLSRTKNTPCFIDYICQFKSFYGILDNFRNDVPSWKSTFSETFIKWREYFRIKSKLKLRTTMSWKVWDPIFSLRKQEDRKRRRNAGVTNFPVTNLRSWNVRLFMFILPQFACFYDFHALL